MKSWVLAGAAVLVAVTAAGGVVLWSGSKQATPAVEPPPANTAKVEKGKLSAMVSLDGTLTYRAQSDGSPYSVINQAQGTYTKLPNAGDKVACGDVLYQVDDNPVLLLCGTVPAYRDLRTGDVGEDVRQLNRNLHTLGYDAKAGVVIDPDDNNFTPNTEKALEMLQHDKGFAVGNNVMAGQVLPQLDAPNLTAQLRQAQATLANAQAAYDKLAQSPLPQDLGAAAGATDVAKAQLTSAQHALAAAQTTAQKNTAAAQVGVANAQQALADTQQNTATVPGILQQQIEQAKAKLYADQTTWDAQVGRGAATKEQRQSALDADQAAIDQVMAATKQQTVQAKQTVNQAQQALKTAQANLETTQAKDGQAVQAAQDQVGTAQAALGQALASYNKTAARPTKADLDAAAAQVEAQKAAVQLAQNKLHTAGELHIDDAIFLPEPVRIVKVTGVLGGSASGSTSPAAPVSSAGPGTQVLSATSDTPEVQVALDPSQQGQVKTGEPAQITLPGNQSVTGKVDRLGRVAQIPSGQNKTAADATIPAYISLDDPNKAGGLDQAPVQVDITTQGVDSALNVPVTALVGKSGGGFAVEVVRAGGRRELVAVKLGLFDTAGGRVQVEGDLGEGDQVVVPSS